jgi:hypothetical protein
MTASIRLRLHESDELAGKVTWGFHRRRLRAEYSWRGERGCSPLVGKRLSECVLYSYMEVRNEGSGAS